jgi:ATP-dependent Clp protease adaptor protein ClpS
MVNSYQEQELTDVLEAVETTDLMDLVVFNDDVNIRVCDHTPEQAEQCTLIIHYRGKCTVKSGSFDFLRPMREAICEAGIDARII